MPIDTLIDTNPGQHHDRVGASFTDDDGHNYGVLSLHRRDRQVEQRRRDQDRLQGRHRAAEPTTSSLFGFGHPVSPDFPGESPGIVWSADEVDRQRARVGVDGLPGRRDAAADGGRGQLGRQRRRARRAARRPRRCIATTARYRRPAEGRCAGRSAPTPRRRSPAIMEGVVERRHRASAAQIPGYTIAGKTGTAAKLINGRYSHTDYNASFVGFIPSRDPAVAIMVVIDSPHGPNGDTWRHGVAAPIFRTDRRSDAALSRHRADDQSDAAGPGGARHARRQPRPPRRRRRRPAIGVSLVADGPPGTMPDLRGLSAREAVRRLVKLGLTARLAGDGFVVSQEPPPGTPLDAGRGMPPGAAAPRTARRARTSHDLGRAARRTARTRPDPSRRCTARAGGGRCGSPASPTIRAASRPGNVFVALKGLHADGAAFARNAIERGAAAVVADVPAPDDVHVAMGHRSDARQALAILATAFYRDPATRCRSSASPAPTARPPGFTPGHQQRDLDSSRRAATGVRSTGFRWAGRR